MQVDDAIDSSLLDVSGAPSGALSSRFKIDQFRVVSINRDSARGVSRAVEVLIEVHHGRPGFYDQLVTAGRALSCPAWFPDVPPAASLASVSVTLDSARPLSSAMVAADGHVSGLA